MLNEILETIPQSLISVIALFVLTRLMGKKQISQLTFFDYVVGISIGSIAGELAVQTTGYARGITGLVVYALFPIVLSYISMKSFGSRKLLDGVPTILIQNGSILQENLKKVKMNVNDLLEECRSKNAFNIADVEFAILETSGRLSIQMKSEHQPLTPKDINLDAAYKGLCLNLIIDGRILNSQLSMIGKDEDWLKQELKKQNISDINDVTLAYIDSSCKLAVQRKNSEEPLSPLM